MQRPRTLILAATSLAAVAGLATAQNAPAPASAASTKAEKPWVAPGTKGSEIDGTVFHAQVLLSTAGFSTSVIDGKSGMVFEKALSGFQEARGLPETGELDAATRTALIEDDPPVDVSVKLTPEDITGNYVYPFPKKPEEQAKLAAMNYRNMLEEVAERYHTTPRTIVALNGPTALIGIGQTLRLPNVIPTARAYDGKLKDEHKALMAKI